MADKLSPIVIGIAGGTGSGKTTVANGILNRVGKNRIAYLPHDAYYRDLHDLPYEQRAAINFDHPDSLESELMIKHIQQLKQGISVDIPIYDFSIHTRTDKTIHVKAQPVIIVEGILIFAEPELRKMFDVKIFVDTDPDLRFIRVWSGILPNAGARQTWSFINISPQSGRCTWSLWNHPNAMPT
jgi:uridine kinase